MQETNLIELAEKIHDLQTELPAVEVKAARQGCPKLFDSLSSLANQAGGGVILFGLDEREGFAPCGVYDAADLQTQVTNQCLQMEPELRPLYTVATWQGHTLVSAEIQEVDMDRKPCFYKGKGRLSGSYVRVGDQDLHMTEYEIYSYEAFRRKLQDELRICERATQADFSTLDCAAFLLAARKSKPNLSRMEDEKVLQLLGLVSQGKPTLAGILMLGEYPQAYYPQLCIVAVAIPGEEMGVTSEEGERFTDNERIEGTLPQILERAMAFVKRNTPTATVIDPKTGKRMDKPMYPTVAVREILLNALIHRDYSIHTESAPIALYLYTNRLELKNPGGLYGRITLDQLGDVVADTRNPYIARAMELMAQAENRYSGIPTIRMELAQNDMRPPVFEIDRGAFVVTFENERIKQAADGNNMRAQILRFCAEPKSRKELEEYFSNVSIIYLMHKYMQPMIREGVIELTQPEKPRSKYQKYHTK